MRDPRLVWVEEGSEAAWEMQTVVHLTEYVLVKEWNGQMILATTEPPSFRSSSCDVVPRQLV